MEMLGHIQRQDNQSSCVQNYQEAINIYRRIEAKVEEAVTHFNIGHAYKDIPGIIDLDTAENSYKQSLSLRPLHDALGRARCNVHIGMVHHRRLLEALGKEEPVVEAIVNHAHMAEKHLLEALQLCPKDAFPDLAPLHNSLGHLYRDVGKFDKAREHYALDAHYEAEAGNRFGAGQTRLSMALMYVRMIENENEIQRTSDLLRRALTFAEAALRDFQSYEGRAAKNESSTQELIDYINQVLVDMPAQ